MICKAYVTIAQNASGGTRKGIRGSNRAKIPRRPADRAPIGQASGAHRANLTWS